MSAIDDLLEPIPIPRVVEVHQSFEKGQVGSIEKVMHEQFVQAGAASRIKPGETIALAVGSRGIADLPLIVRSAVTELRKLGADPFIVPAMGSHGGATPEGQQQILEDMGVTEAFTTAPVRSSMETTQVGITESGLPVFMDSTALEADSVIIINRIHPHVAFRGKYESGLMKMLAIGLGKLRGANICHDLGFGEMGKNVHDIGKVCLEKTNVIFGIAVLENAYHKVYQITMLPAEEIESKEPELLELAKELEPCLYFDKIDVLIMDEIGKDISGSGFDTNIIGRYGTPFITGGPNITKISILDVTDVSHGNCTGLGLADFTTRRVFDKFSFEDTYPNSLTSTVQAGIKIPMVLKNDRQAIQGAIKTCNILDKDSVRLVWITSTLEIDKIFISESLLEEAQRQENLTITGEPFEIAFDDLGNITRPRSEI